MTPYYADGAVTVYHADVTQWIPLADGSVQCVVTSPPYWNLRDYQVEGQLGLESTPELYVARMVAVFREVKRVLRDDGTLWLNIGSSFASGIIESDDAILREDLTDDEYRQTLSALWGTDESSESDLPSMSSGYSRATAPLPNNTMPGVRPDVHATHRSESQVLFPIVREIGQSDSEAGPAGGCVSDMRETIREVSGGDPEDAAWSALLQPDLLVQPQSTGQSLSVGWGPTWPDESRGHHVASSGTDQRPLPLSPLSREPQAGGSSYPPVHLSCGGSVAPDERRHAVPDLSPTIPRAGVGVHSDSVVHRVRAGRRLALRLPWAQIPSPLTSAFRSVSRWKPKDLVNVPHLLAEALRADGWYLRSEIIWHKPNPMPESVGDRPTKSHEQIFLLTKRATYFYDADAVREPALWAHDARAGAGHIDYNGKRDGAPGTGQRAFVSINPAGRNLRTVWTIATAPFSGAHFATFPPNLAARCILAGTSEKGACPACGAPWARVVERGDLVPDAPGYTPRGRDRGDSFVKNAMVPSGASIGHPNFHYQATTLGWAPGCACGVVDTTPCLVLDPFAGALTTLHVAKELGRHAVGVELNRAYIDLGTPRCAQGVLF